MNTHRRTTNPPRLRRQLKKLGAIAGAAALVSAVLVPLGSADPAAAATPVSTSYTTPGNYSYTVPAGVHSLQLTVSGGAGGNDRGGNGARVTGYADVSPGDRLVLQVASRGGTGADGGGGESGGEGGSGYRSGGDGGSGSISPFVPSVGQGGGGGGGASAVLNGPDRLVLAAGGGGGGGFAVCGGNPGGNAGSNGSKVNNSCVSNGGDPGHVGVSPNGHGYAGSNASSSSGQGGGGGGGAGVRGGGGADASTDGGGGGGGGTSSCLLDDCSMTYVNSGHGSIVISPVHTPVVEFTNESYSAHTGNQVTFSGTVATQASTGGTPAGNVTLHAASAAGDSQLLATVPLNAEGYFSYTCTAPCGADLDDAASVRADYQSSNSEHWTNATGSAALAFINAETQTSLFIDPTQAVTGQVRNFTATVNVLQPAQGVVSGDVEFWMSNIDGTDATLLGTSSLAPNYQATLEAGVPEAKAKRFWAVYPGAAGFNGSQSPKQTLGTDQAETEIMASTTPNPTVTGQPFDLEASVTVQSPGAGTPTGDVTVTSDTGTFTATLDPAGEVTVPIDGHRAGELEFAVAYAGDENFHPSSTMVAHTVERAEVVLGLTIDEMTSQYGESFTLTSDAAVVAPGAGEVTGEVEFGVVSDGEFVALADPVELDGERAELTVEGLDAGDHELQARYAGSDDFLPAASPIVFHTVYMIDATVTVTPMPETSTYSLPQLAVITVTSADDETLVADGDVQLLRVFDDGTEEDLSGRVTLDNAGEAVVEFDRLDPDTYEVYAVYAGSDNFTSALSETTTFTVEQAQSLVELSGAARATVGEAQTFSIDVSAFAQLEIPADARDSATHGHAEGEGIAPLAMPFSAADTQPIVDVINLDFAPTGTVDLLVDGARVMADVELFERADGSVAAVATATHTFTESGTHEVSAVYGGDAYVLPGESAPMAVEVAVTPVLSQLGLAGTGISSHEGMLASSVLLILAGTIGLHRARRRTRQ